MQHPFIKFSFFSYLLLAAFILGVHYWLRSLPNRHDRPDRAVPVRYVPLNYPAAGFAPLRVAGAWRVEVREPRFGGISALALDGESLLALTDSGTAVRLPKPGSRGQAILHDLPGGPGIARFKRNRDSEALVRDQAGRGWWVAFEHWNQLWLYDPAFRKVIGTVDLGRGRWRTNRGIEAMVAGPAELRLFPEGGKEWLRLRGCSLVRHRLANNYGQVADAVTTNNGHLLLVTRRFGLTGIAKRLLLAEEKNGRLRVRPLAELQLGPLANVEALAAEPLPDDGTRLWLMTDNDFRPGAPTLLVALDLP